MQDSNNDKSKAEIIIKTYEHHPSIKLIKVLIPKENNNFNIKAAIVKQINKIIKGFNPKKATWPEKIPVKIVKLSTSIIDSHLTIMINNDLSQVQQGQLLLDQFKKKMREMK